MLYEHFTSYINTQYLFISLMYRKNPVLVRLVFLHWILFLLVKVVPLIVSSCKVAKQNLYCWRIFTKPYFHLKLHPLCEIRIICFY